jgi:hypothetical protein
VRPPARAVEQQIDVNPNRRPRLSAGWVMRISLSSSPAWGCGARPLPRSSSMPTACTRAVSDVLLLAMPASVCMPNSVWARAKERKSAGA